MAKKIGVTMEVGNDGVAVITISNPPVNSLASPSIKKLLTFDLIHYVSSLADFCGIFFSYFWVEGEVSRRESEERYQGHRLDR